MFSNKLQTNPSSRPRHRLPLAVALSATLAFASVPVAGLSQQTAWAEDIDTNVQADAAQQEVERTAAEYDQAISRIDDLNQQIADNEARIAEIEETLPAQQERSSAAQEEAARQAEEAAKAAEAEAAKAQAEEADKQEQADSVSAPAAAEAAGGSSTGTVEAPSDDGADWASERDVFVAQWAGRIDAYLAGSPMAGTGKVFAEAAWDYGVDPRWSPAISNTESSKGLYCSGSCNAWGWGGCSWGSWEEAIRDHVAGLARGYGYTISVEAAKKYCPPNWEHWYNATLAQMNMI